VEINEGPTGGLNKWVRKTLTTDYSVQTSPTTFVRFVTAPANNVKVRVLRDSEANIGIVDFANGSVLTETELDNAYEHNRYLAQEAEEGIGGGSLSKKGGDHYNADGLKIENIADPENDGDAVNKGYADGRYVNVTGDTMTGPLTLPDDDPTDNNQAARKGYVDSQIAGAVLTGEPGGQIDTANIADGAVTSDKLSLTTLHIGDGTARSILSIQSVSQNNPSEISFEGPNQERARISGGLGEGAAGGFLKFNVDTVDGTNVERMSINNDGFIFIKNNTSDPASNPSQPSDGGTLYVENGALKYRGSSGTITTIANA